jgi:hypothetical protein
MTEETTQEPDRDDEVRAKIQETEKRLRDAKELVQDAMEDHRKAQGELHVLKRMLEDTRSETEKNKAYLDKQQEIARERWERMHQLRKINVESGLMSEAEAQSRFRPELCGADRKAALEIRNRKKNRQVTK